MEVKAITKNVRMSPMKVRDVARTLKGRPANEAMDLLRFIPRKSARLISKTLASAIANAENNHQLSARELVVVNARVDQGIAFKRFKPVARGSAHPIRKKTAHIIVTLKKAEVATEATAKA